MFCFHPVGADGVLAVFTSALAFSSREPTAEEGRYDAINGIELILVISFFILFGSILPMKGWASIGLIRLLGFSVAVIFLRRLPIMLALGRYVPELNREPGGAKANFIQSWFVGFYGPIGVGALFYSTLSQVSILCGLAWARRRSISCCVCCLSDGMGKHYNTKFHGRHA